MEGLHQSLLRLPPLRLTRRAYRRDPPAVAVRTRLLLTATMWRKPRLPLIPARLRSSIKARASSARSLTDQGQGRIRHLRGSASRSLLARWVTGVIARRGRRRASRRRRLRSRRVEASNLRFHLLLGYCLFVVFHYFVGVGGR